MVSAIIGEVLGAMGNQSRPITSQAIIPRQDLSTQAIAHAGSDKRAKQALKNADKERLQSLLQDPAVIGMLTMLAGLYLAEQIPWSGDPARDRVIKTMAIMGVLLMSLGRAGVGDTTTAAVAASAGIASALSSALSNVNLNPTVEIPRTGLDWSPWTGLLGNLW